MSDIDLYPHEYCGTLGRLPVYHLTEPNPARDFKDVNSDYLLLGGGGGEHPAAIINIPHAISRYLFEWEIRLGAHKDYKKEYYTEVGLTAENVGSLSDEFDILIEGKIPYDKELDFSDWPGDAWAKFYKIAKSKMNSAPYKRKKYDSIEFWVALSLGEYALVSMPEIIPTVGVLSEPSQVTLTKLRDTVAHGYAMGNVKQFPRGYQIAGHGHGGLGDPNMRY